MPYAEQPRELTHNAPHAGRNGAAYRAAVDVVRERARRGERCWFWRKPGHQCSPRGIIDLRAHYQSRWGFTAHHLDRIMDGGVAVPDPRRMAPAHRGCNARDGLLAQNARRAARRASQATGGYRIRPLSSEVPTPPPSPTVTDGGMGRDRQSRQW